MARNLPTVLPFYDSEKMLAFGQVGARYIDSRFTANLGAGQRFFLPENMLGYNVFIDQDFSGDNTRERGRNAGITKHRPSLLQRCPGDPAFGFDSIIFGLSHGFLLKQRLIAGEIAIGLMGHGLGLLDSGADFSQF